MAGSVPTSHRTSRIRLSCAGSPGVRGMRAGVCPCPRACPFLLGPLPDGVERRARRRRRRAGAAIDWSVAAMTEAAARLASSGSWDLPHLAEAVSDAIWWVTLIDATLVRYHPRNYEGALAGRSARRRETEQTLEGLRYVRNQLGKSADPASFIQPASGDRAGGWAWRPLPPPDLADLGPRARRWEQGRTALSGAPGPARHHGDVHLVRRVPHPRGQPGRGCQPPPYRDRWPLASPAGVHGSHLGDDRHHLK